MVILPSKVRLNVDIKAGYILDLREPDEAAPKIIDAEPAESSARIVTS